MKKDMRREVTGTSATYQTNLYITKGKDWKPLITVTKGSASDAVAVENRPSSETKIVIPLEKRYSIIDGYKHVSRYKSYSY